ncbi:hypothetical protein GGR56DRAFT_637451 [Xylariaceae sp. FL0804]|nr:hypothetical protein GGR56DRAFT_637451 [Xylariaceae sp. FL0804]
MRGRSLVAAMSAVFACLFACLPARVLACLSVRFPRSAFLGLLSHSVSSSRFLSFSRVQVGLDGTGQRRSSQAEN